MYDLDAIKHINIEQLVTPLDRLLLSSRHASRTPTRRSFDLAHEAALAVAASKRRRAALRDDAADRTYVMRAHRPRSRELLGAAAVVALLTWLSVVALCLLA